MLFADKEKERRERFLRQFDQTARVAFINSSSKLNHERRPTKALLDLARPALGYTNETPARIIYKDLVYVWRMMRKRSTAWNGNIDLAPADIEDY